MLYVSHHFCDIFIPNDCLENEMTDGLIFIFLFHFLGKNKNHLWDERFERMKNKKEKQVPICDVPSLNA